MCGIIGLFGIENASEKVREGLEIIKNRGRDGCGITNGTITSFAKDPAKLKLIEGKNILGHVLHSIVGEVKQPLDNKFVVNCEIYNWKELGFEADNDAEALLKLIEKIGVKEAIKKLDGVYAFGYWNKNEIYICRDLLGIKPIWYSTENGFAFASEKKVLIQLGFKEIVELNPRTILIYNLKNKKYTEIKRDFFKLTPQIKKNEKKIIEELKGYITNAIAKRIPDKEFGILLSGGVDSSLIALICKQLDLDFTCYTSALEEEGMEESRDLIAAKEFCKEYDIKLKVIRFNLKEVEEYLREVVPLIEDNNVVKVGVGLTFYAACKLASKDKIKVIFSGLGSEELFAGYERHKRSSNVNKECLSGLIKIYERDLYRDDVVTMNNSIELRVPFLDLTLVKYALRIPAKFKLNDNENKLILRKVASLLGLDNKFAFRKKLAAQYGSKFDRAIDKLARINKCDNKSDYLKRFYTEPNVKLALLASTGKDSWYAGWRMIKQNYSIECLVNIRSKNKDSFMFHTPNIELIKKQAEAADIPLIVQETAGKKEVELKDLEIALKKAIKEYEIEGVVTGAIFSNYQRERIEKICDKLGLKIFAPLWHMNQEEELHELVKEKFEVIIGAIACDGLNEKWLGRKIDNKTIEELVKLSKINKMNIAGEGGEYESLVLNCPLFKKAIKITKAEKRMNGEFNGIYLIKEVRW